LTSESYPISDVTLMLNNQAPESKPKIIYQNDLAKNELGMEFQPVRIPLTNVSA
jgi:dihydroflavonol-4-reductase